MDRNRVGTYVGVGANRGSATRRTARAAQQTMLPPRCTHCRQPGTIITSGVPHCPDHTHLNEADCG